MVPVAAAGCAKKVDGTAHPTSARASIGADAGYEGDYASAAESSAPGDGGAAAPMDGVAAAAPEAVRSATKATRAGDADALSMEEPEPSGYDRNIQAGRLTAGSFDDTLNPAVFTAFARSMTHNQSTASIARRLTDGFTTITVTDGNRAVAGATVHLRDGQHAAGTLVTGTDGRAIVIHGHDVAGPQPQARVDGGQWQSLSNGNLTIKTSLRATPIRALDVALVVDATGSMGDELEYLKVELSSIAKRVKREFPDVDQRFALVVYRDEGDQYVTRAFDFTADMARLDRRLGRQSADGGGDYPEAMDAALHDASELSWRTQPGAARVAFLIADAPPHPRAMAETMNAVENLRAQGVGIYPVAASGVASEAELVMRASAVATGGQYLFLTDDSGVGNPHAEPHIPCYAVEQLRDAMGRMLVTEIAGRHIEADPRRLVRHVGQQSAPGVCAPARRGQ